MDFVLHNLRLQELVAIVRENKRFYDDFVNFLQEEGYKTILEFIRDESDEKASSTISKYLARSSDVKLMDSCAHIQIQKQKGIFLPGCCVMRPPSVSNPC